MTAAPSLVEALMYSLRSRGIAALGEPVTLRRLSQLDRRQTLAVAVRLQALKPEIAAPWDDGQVEKIFEAKGALV